jgi:hypothetical protein
MHKSTYLGQCQVRHPQFQRDLLAFRRQFPLLLERSSERAYVPSRAPSRWFEFVALPYCYVMVIPRTFDALPRLRSMETMRFGKRLFPESGERYFRALAISSSAYEQAWTALRHKWPSVPEAFLLYGRMSDAHRPSLLIPSEPFSQKAWTDQVSHAAHATKLMIPIYEDTTLEEVTSLWKQHIQPLKKWVYREPEEAPEAGDGEQGPAHQAQRPARRQRPDQYEKRLEVWDAYQAFGNFVEVAKSLRQRPSTVKSTYIQASRDIYGSSEKPRRGRHGRLLEGYDPATHMQRCPICRSATTENEFCAQTRAYINQDYRAQRERPHSHDQLERLPHARSGSHS